LTIEERFERIEHLTAGLAEERHQDREEYKTLWRATRRQIDRAAEATANLARQIDRLAIETRDADQKLGARIDQLAQEARAADEKLAARIDSLVSAIGQFIAGRQQ